MRDPKWRCDGCSHWRRKSDTRWGICQRNAPERDPKTNQGKWPETKEDESCGEWHDKQIYEREKS